MKETKVIHICDICGKEDNLGDKYESGESVLQLKGNIGSSYANGGYSFDDTYDLCLDCTKMMKEFISDKKLTNKQ